MNLNVKSIAIAVIIGLSLAFFSSWYFGGNNDYKTKIKSLESDESKMQLERDSLYKVNNTLKIGFNSLQDSVNNYQIKINSTESELKQTKIDLSDANKKVTLNQQQLDATDKKIDFLSKNPIKREDDVLLNSLKEKLK
jgi:chromosome segregation ATPase